MSMDLTGITNQNEYYTNHYFSSIFEENASETISKWRAEAKNNDGIRTPWSLLRDAAKLYYPLHDRYVRAKDDSQILSNICLLADTYLEALGYPDAQPELIEIDDTLKVPVYLEINKANGAPLLWILLAASPEKDDGVLEKHCFSADTIGEDNSNPKSPGEMTTLDNEELATKILFGAAEPPRFLIFIGMNQLALLDRNKWNEKRYLQFELEEIFSRREESTLQAMAVLLHRNSLCPKEGIALIDELDANSQKHAAGVSQDLKYALRESIELLGNEVLYDMANRQGRNLDTDPVDAGQLTMECLRYMYRMLFVLFIESRPELGYAPLKAQSYMYSYSLESLRDIADNIRDDVEEVGSGYYLDETLSKLFELIYNGYPDSEEDILKYSSEESLHDMFVIVPLKAHIFDPEYTKLITNAKLRNSAMLRIIDLMSLTRNEGQRNSRRGRISYADLGINQLGSVYEALLSYRGFIAEHTLYEVKRAGDSFNELDVGYFVSEDELDQYTEDERVRYERGENRGKLRSYEKGTFIYRLAGREREKSASYYTPEVLTKCLVKYALKELLEDKTADEVLNLTVCEPAMGSAAFLNEAINQLAEAYLDKKQKELGEVISYEKRFTELQKVKMFIADRNVYGIDLNPVAVELAEVSLWLNTIFEGGYVPWFGTQLVCGNSLIGARRQCYHVNQLTATAAGVRWYENAPERVPLGTKRKPQTQIYHFLLGDPGMSNYSDRVIKSLEPDKIENIKKWNKKFSSPYNDDELVTLLRLSAVIDNLWEAQVILRKKVHEKTKDSLSIYGHEDHSADSHTTIRQKDKILSELYKSERVKNAGPYARLKFAMDYWCALWFWPIDKEELLPSRSEFLFDMSLILEGTTESVQVTDTVTSKKTYRRQLSLFPTEMQQMEQDIVKTYGTDTTVDIPALRASNPRLNLAYEIAENNRFMHWELEFADLFAERDGFDLIVGNPPWVLLGWNEQAILSDNHPQFAVKNLNATQTTQHRTKVLQNAATKKLYVYEYILVSGQQSFLNATQNYANLAGMKANLYKCFLPQAWQFGSSIGVSAFVHPNGIYDDPKGGQLREKQYPRLKQHFQFENELNLFTGTNDHGRMRFSLNVYSNKTSSNFDAINNLFTTSTIEECYDDSIKGKIPGIKDDEGKWEIKGHPGRVLHITKKELKLFSHVFDGDDNWRQARLPMLHASAFVEVLERMSEQPTTLTSLGEEMYTTQMWNETQAQNAGIIIRDIHFPIEHYDGIFSGAHMGVLNPFYKCMKRVYNSNNDYDCTDLTVLPSNYYQRCMYNIGTEMVEYLSSIPRTKYDRIYTSQYRLFVRKMLNQNGERTLIGAIMPPKVGHTHGILGISFKDEKDLILVAGLFASLPYDFYVKSLGKSNFQSETALPMPLINGILADLISNRTLLLNSVSINYSNIWQRFEYTENDCWSKEDPRMNRMSFESLSFPWSYNSPLRTDYERRQALVEIDVLSSIALGTTLEQLKTIYRLQFPILVQYENDTWYDANGRIVFTINRSLNNVGFTRSEWNNGIKGAPAGKKFYRTITDDTMPGGPIERTIEYVAPFDRCDREQDYETAWAFFEEKYGKQGS